MRAADVQVGEAYEIAPYGQGDFNHFKCIKARVIQPVARGEAHDVWWTYYERTGRHRGVGDRSRYLLKRSGFLVEALEDYRDRGDDPRHPLSIAAGDIFGVPSAYINELWTSAHDDARAEKAAWRAEGARRVEQLERALLERGVADGFEVFASGAVELNYRAACVLFGLPLPAEDDSADD